VLDPGEKLDGLFDLLIVDGKIAEVRPGIRAQADKTIEVPGLIMTPGFIDLHVHLREPGFEHKETIASGSRAAARGGFTTVCCMPNTNPVNDCPEITRLIISKAAREAAVNVLPVAAVTRNQRGLELAPILELVEAGAVALSDDGQPVQSSALMMEAMKKAAELGVLLIDHCEEKSLAGAGLINEGRVSRLLGVKGIPAVAEEVMVARDIILAKESGLPVHLAHLSTKGSVELLSWAKDNQIPVTAEVTPHHLLLTEDALLTRDANYKVNPPLRTEEDVKCLRQALRDGLIDIIATDHAPHAEEEKNQGLERAPFGINGLETAIPALLDKLVKQNELSLRRLVEALSTIPARLLKLDTRGKIKPGAVADLTLLNPEEVIFISRENFQSKSLNTPFLGSHFQGAVTMTIVNGRVAYPF